MWIARIAGLTPLFAFALTCYRLGTNIPPLNSVQADKHMKPTRIFFWLNLLVCLLIAGPAFAQKTTTARAAPQQTTVPLLVDRNRPYVDLTFQRPDGSKRSARFLVDSGGGGFALTEPLARDLGLKWGATMREEGAEFAQVTDPLKAFVGDFPLELDPQRVLVVIGADTILPKGVAAPHDGMLPGHVLAKYHVVFDYPKAEFTIARAGVLGAEGNSFADAGPSAFRISPH